MLQQEKSPIVAGILAIIPGLGHFYLRDTFYAILYFILFWIAGFAAFLYCKRSLGGNYLPMLIFVGIWLYGIYDAYNDTVRLNAEIASGSA